MGVVCAQMHTMHNNVPHVVKADARTLCKPPSTKRAPDGRAERSFGRSSLDLPADRCLWSEDGVSEWCTERDRERVACM